MNNSAIVDTGTTLCLLDDATLKKIYQAIPGGGYNANWGYVFPTASIKRVPTFYLDIGGKRFSIDPAFMAFCNADAQGVYQFGAFQSRGNMSFDIFGDVFLRNCYSVSVSMEIVFDTKSVSDIRRRELPVWLRSASGLSDVHVTACHSMSQHVLWDETSC
jgi:hypothetical protein